MSADRPPPQAPAGSMDRGTVLAPLDGSPVSRLAMSIARAAGRLLDVPIHVLHAVEAPVAADELLRRVGLGANEIAGTILEQATGDAARVILDEVAAHHTRLIVLTSKGEHAGRDGALGRVAEEILRRAACSILLVRAEIAERLSAEQRRLERILIPMDGTPATAAALGPAAELAARSGARLDILHVAAAGRPEAERGTMTVPQYEDQPSHEWSAWRTEFSARFLGLFEGQVTNLEVAAGDPAVEILRAAREHNSDLIVLAWKGDFAPERAQTVRRLLQEAPCAVLLLRTRPSLELPSGVVEVRVSGA